MEHAKEDRVIVKVEWGKHHGDLMQRREWSTSCNEPVHAKGKKQFVDHFSPAYDIIRTRKKMATENEIEGVGYVNRYVDK